MQGEQPSPLSSPGQVAQLDHGGPAGTDTRRPTCTDAHSPLGLVNWIPGALGLATVSPVPSGPAREAMLRIHAWLWALPPLENRTI